MYHLEYMYIVSAYKYILAYGSNLLAYMAHAVAKPYENFFHRLKKTGITYIFDCNQWLRKNKSILFYSILLNEGKIGIAP